VKVALFAAVPSKELANRFHRKTPQLVFRGTASDSLSNDPEKNERKLEKAVDKMFKKFPPERE